MQQRRKLSAAGATRVALLLGVVGVAAGCPSGPAPPPAAGVPRSPGVSLTVACTDAVYAGRLSQQAKAWAGRTGVAVRVVPDAAAADILVLPPGRLGAALSRPGAEFLPLPVALKANDHPMQRGRVAEAYRDTLTNWAGEVVGLPLVADGAALVYRADRFAAEADRAGFARRFGRPLLPPRTYEDVAEVAAYFHAAGRPSLPPLPAGPGELSLLFLRVVACSDRNAAGDAEAGRGAKGGAGTALALLADPATGAPRFGGPGFLAAARWLAATAPYRPEPGVAAPGLAIDTGAAVLDLVDLRDLARLPLDPATGAVSDRFAVAPLPGTRSFFAADGQSTPAAGEGNYVPYLGAHSLVGVVTKACADPQAAWDFLADGATAAGSAATLSDPATGSGPFRREHVDEANERVWLGYRFDAEQSRNLGLAMRRFLALNVPNPVTVPRLPDADARLAALDGTLRRLGTGRLPPDAAMAEATAAWKALDAKQPADALARDRRHAVGLP